MLYIKPIGVSVALVISAICSTPISAAPPSGEKEVTLIHIGDIHGHTTSRPNLRSDGDGKMEGGLARMYTKIKQIKNTAKNPIVLNTGDTTQGSGEALYTRGQALVDVVDLLGVDAFAPGNWDYVYGPQRFLEFFGNGRWGALAANLYHTNPNAANDGIPPTLPRIHTQEEYDAWSQWYLDNGSRLLPPYRVHNLAGVKLGVIGCTTRRGPQVVGSWVVDGIEFTDCEKEVVKYVKELRDPAGPNVDAVILITEIEVGVNIEMVRTNPELSGNNYIDVILNSDMHEETAHPIEITTFDGLNKTLLIEEGMDGTMLGELKLTLANGHVSNYNFTAHRIDDTIAEDPAVAKKVAKVRAPFTTGFNPAIPCTPASPYYNSFSGTCLKASLDSVIGYTDVDLHRSNYTDENMPAVLEGTSHDLIADAMRWWAQSDLATVRGFRYGTSVKAGGPIRRADLYHYIPIGARAAKVGRLHATQLRNQVDNSSQAVFSSDPISALVRAAPYNNNGWAGGWMFAYSAENFSVTLDPYWFRTAPTDSRARDLTISLPCDRLPATIVAPETESEKTKCINSGAGSAVTHVTNTTNGAFLPNWNIPIPGVTVYALQTDPPVGEFDWDFRTSVETRPHRLPILTVAGYWYEQSPLKINNCPNCNPVGLSGDDTNADAPYILPVNVNPDTGNAWLDANGKPVMLDVNGNPILDPALVDPSDIMRDAENRPIAAGEAIEIVEVIAKYLAATGNANPVQNRVKLPPGVSLPGRDVHGFPVMQPLCGTIPKTATDTTDYSTLQCWK